MSGDGGWMGSVMWLVWILLIVVILVIVRGVAGSRSSSPPDPRETPLDILKERHARGEIDEEEFNRRRRALEK